MVQLPLWVIAAWTQQHHLGRAELDWIEEHADPGDTHPIVTAVEQLRATPWPPLC